MIERYSRPEMARIWEPESRFRRILEVEAAFLDELAGPKKLPQRELRAFRAVVEGRPLAAEVRRREAKTGHDVVALLQVVSERLKRKAPAVVRYLHYGLTSSDVLDTALALQLRDAAGLLLEGWRRVLDSVRVQASRHAHTWMAGRTHGVHAEPTTFGLKLAGWHAEARRNISRLSRARVEIAAGKLSGAVGSYAHCPPALEARILRRLGLKAEPISTQVVPRDRHADFFCALALSACAIERFATEIRHLQRTEVREVEEPFARGQKGSSAMPHKRNPVLCENLCGLARIIRGHAVAVLEDCALWHERDISHSSVERIALPDATMLLDFMLHRFAGVVEGLLVYPDRMRSNLDASKGLVFSQSLLLALIDKGLGRMRAYDIVQRNSMETWASGRDLKSLIRADGEVRALMTEGEIDRCFDLAAYGRSVRQVLSREGIL